MRRLKRFTVAAILAVTIFFNASFGKEAPIAEDKPEEVETISPVHYDDSAELAELDKRRQAHQAEVNRIARAEAERQRHIAVRVKRVAEAEAERKRAILAVKAKQAELAQSTASKPAKQPSKEVSRGQAYVGKAQSYTATAYTAYCAGCSGITKTGVNLRQSIYHEGKRVIAVDPRYIPLGSIVRITLSNGSSFEAIAEDIGGAIRGQLIDVAHETTQEAYVFGRQSVEVRMIRKGR